MTHMIPIEAYEFSCAKLNFRYPYDINENDCCRTTISDSKTNPVEIFSVQQKGVCAGAGGDVVISAEGDPHNYLVLSN